MATCSMDTVSGPESHWDLLISAERGDEKDTEQNGTNKNSDLWSPELKDRQTY